MKRLILLRHGKAQGDAPSGKDFDRALTERGAGDAAAMGRTLAGAGFIPDLALVSPATRTRETWDQVQPAFPDARVEYAASLYDAAVRTIRALAQVADGEAVMVVGHNPGLQDLAIKLAVEARADEAAIARTRSHFPPATAAIFALDADGRPTLEGLFYPEGRG